MISLIVMMCSVNIIGSMRIDKMPMLEEILGGRRLAMEKGGTMKEGGKFPFFYFCNKILECVAEKKKWKVEKHKLLISASCVTVSDEAFAMLLMINSWDKFEYLADHPEIEDKATVPSTKFTEEKGRNRKLQGWTREGINTFNKLCQDVMEDRASKEGKRFELEFKSYHAAEELKQKTKLDVDESGSESDDEVEESTQRYVFNHLKDLAGASGNASGHRVAAPVYDSDDNLVETFET